MASKGFYRPSQPAADALSSSPELAAEIEALRPYYNQIEVATNYGQPSLTEDKFCAELAQRCRETGLSPDAIIGPILDYISALKDLIEYAIKNNDGGPSLDPKDYFTHVTTPHFGQLPAGYVPKYLELMEQCCAKLFKVEGIHEALKPLGLESLIFHLILGSSDNPEDPKYPYTLQIGRIFFAQLVLEMGSPKSVEAELNTYAQNGMFPRDIERINQFADHANPKFGAVLSYTRDLYEQSQGITNSAFSPETPLEELFNHITHPHHASFLPAIKAFCARADSESIGRLVVELKLKMQSKNDPHVLFALQLIIKHLSPANIRLLAAEIFAHPLILLMDLNGIEDSLSSNEQSKQFFGELRSLIAADSAHEEPEKMKSIFTFLHTYIRSIMGEGCPPISAEVFAQKAIAICREESVDPATLHDDLNHYFTIYAGFYELVGPSDSFNLLAANEQQIGKYLELGTALAKASIPVRSHLKQLGLMQGGNKWPSNISDADGEFSAYFMLAVQVLVSAKTLFDQDDIQKAAMVLDRLDSSDPENFALWDKLAQYAPPEYGPFISLARFNLLHVGAQGDLEKVGGHEDYERMAVLRSAINGYSDTRPLSPTAPIEELRAFTKSRRFGGTSDAFWASVVGVASVVNYNRGAPNIHQAYQETRKEFVNALYFYALKRYFGHYRETVSGEFVFEIMELVAANLATFIPGSLKDRKAESHPIIEEIAALFEQQTGKSLAAPDDEIILAESAHKDRTDTLKSTVNVLAKIAGFRRDEKVEANKVCINNFDLLLRTSNGRNAIFGRPDLIKNDRRSKIIAAAQDLEELIRYYNFLNNSFAPDYDLMAPAAPRLNAEIIEGICSTPGYLSQLLANATFYQDGVDTTALHGFIGIDVPRSLFLRLFAKARPGDSLYVQLAAILQNPNAETYCNACFLVGMLLKQDPRHAVILKSIFSSPAAFTNKNNLLFLYMLLQYCDQLEKAFVSRYLAEIIKSEADKLDLSGMVACFQSHNVDFKSHLKDAGTDAKNGKQRDKSLKPPAPDPYSGLNFVKQYPDIALTKERNLEELATEIIDKRTIALPDQGAALSTGFADSPLREVFSHAIVKADRATLVGPRSLRVLVQLEGVDKVKLFCRVQDDGALQIRILKDGTEKQTIVLANAEENQLSSKIFVELNYFVLEILRSIYVKIAEPAEEPAISPPPVEQNPEPPHPTEEPPASNISPDSGEAQSPDAPLTPTPSPDPVAPPSPSEPAPLAVKARAMGSMSIILGTKADKEEKDRAAKERRSINENLLLIREIFLPIYQGQTYSDLPDKINEITLYIAEQMPGKRGEPTQELFYRKIDPLDALIGLSEGTIAFVQVFARKGRLHSQPLPYLVDDSSEAGVLTLKKSRQTDLAAERYRLALEDGQAQVDQAPVSSILRIKVSDDPESRLLLDQIRGGFMEKFAAARIREVEQDITEQQLQYQQSRRSWEGLLLEADNEADIGEIKAIIAEMDSTHQQLRAALEDQLESLSDGLSIVPEHASAKDGLIAFPQPGTFEFNQTFNQGSFISLEELLSSKN